MPGIGRMLTPLASSGGGIAHRVDTMLPPLPALRRALVVAAAAVLTSPRSLRAAADVDSTAGLRLDGAALQRARQQQL